MTDNMSKYINLFIVDQYDDLNTVREIFGTTQYWLHRNHIRDLADRPEKTYEVANWFFQPLPEELSVVTRKLSVGRHVFFQSCGAVQEP